MSCLCYRSACQLELDLVEIKVQKTITQKRLPSPLIGFSSDTCPLKRGVLLDFFKNRAKIVNQIGEAVRLQWIMKSWDEYCMRPLSGYQPGIYCLALVTRVRYTRKGYTLKMRCIHISWRCFWNVFPLVCSNQVNPLLDRLIGKCIIIFLEKDENTKIWKWTKIELENDR